MFLFALTRLFIILAVQALPSPTVTATCFKSVNQIGDSGSDDSGDVPCDPNANVSACCGARSICISNLHCFVEGITTPNVPGTCTDQSFENPACPCPPVTSLDYTVDMTSCPDGSYCCGHNNTACCGTTDSRLEIFYGNPARIPSENASLSSYYSSLHISTKSRSSTVSSVSQSTPVGSPATVSSSSAVDSTKLGSPTTLTPTTAPETDPKSSGLNKSGKIAVGILIPLVVVLASLSAWWILYRRRSLKPTRPGIEVVEMVAPNSVPTELSPGLDRAELTTKEGNTAELPPSHEINELQ